MLDLPSELIRKFFKVTTPVILNESVWALVIFEGFGNAAKVIIGNKIGSGNEDEALMDAMHFITLNPILAMLAGLATFLGWPFLLSAYNVLLTS